MGLTIKFPRLRPTSGKLGIRGAVRANQLWLCELLDSLHLRESDCQPSGSNHEGSGLCADPRFSDQNACGMALSRYVDP
jgi:hypothetical protein